MSEPEPDYFTNPSIPNPKNSLVPTINADGSVDLPVKMQLSRGGVAPSARQVAEVTLFDLPEADNSPYVVGEDGIERNETENPRARQAFKTYLALGSTRTLAKLAAYFYHNETEGWTDITYGSILIRVREYAHKYGWHARAKLYTVAQSAKAIAKANSVAAKRRDRRVKLSDKMMAIAENLMDKSGLTDADGLHQLSREDAILLLPHALRFAEAGLRHDKTETETMIEKTRPTKPIDAMDDAELDAFIAQLQAESGVE